MTSDRPHISVPMLTTTHWAAIVFVIALVLRLTFVAVTTITPMSDAERYLGHAERLIGGQGFVSPDGTPTAYTPPGYPFFIAVVQTAFGAGYRPVAYAQAVLGALCCVLTFLLCHRLFDRRHALVAALLLALSPASIPYAGGLLSEVPTTLIVLGVLLLLAPSAAGAQAGLARTAIAGLFLGVAILFRPAMMAVAGGLGVWVLWRGIVPLTRRFATATVLTVATVLVLLPWSYRNYQVYDTLVPVSTMGGYDLYMGNNPSAYGGGYVSLAGEQELRRWEKPADEVNGEKEARRRALVWIRENPDEYVGVTLRRAMKWISVAPDYAPATRLTSTADVDRAILQTYRARAAGAAVAEPAVVQRSRRMNATVLFLWSILTLPLALFGIVLDVASRQPKWLLVSPLIAYAVALVLVFMDLRYREVMMPVLMIYTAAGLFGVLSFRDRWTNASSKGRGVLLLLGLSLALLFCLQLFRDRAVLGVILGSG